MKVEDQFTTEEQSNKLRTLGFTSDTASFIEIPYINLFGEEKSSYVPKCVFLDNAIIEASCVWSIGDMIELLPNSMSDKDAFPYVNSDGVFYSYCDYDDFKDIKDFFECDLLRDNLFDCLLWLKENKYL